MKWIQIDSWHILESSGLDVAGVPTAWTRCGLQRRPWSGEFLDRLPGGDEKSCENCLKLEVRELDAPPAPKRTRKAK